MNETLKTKIEDYCNMVALGVKPLSFMAHQDRYYDEIVEIIKSNKLHYSSEILSDGWRTIYIYKNKTIRFLIPHLPDKPKTASEHMFIGLMLGYGIDSICDYIVKNCELEESNLI